MSKNIASSLEKNSIFSCDWNNEGEVNNFESIPLLVRNYDTIKSLISEAKRQGKADWYEGNQEELWQGPYRHHLLKRKKYVEQVLQVYSLKRPIKSLLDLGCGDGANFSWLKGYTENLYGSDYNITRLVRAKNRNIAKEVGLVDVTDYAAADNTFDVIFFNHVLEHIPNDIKALSEVYRILKKGGICILGVPNEGAFWWQLAFKLQPNSLKTTDHVHFYTIKALSEKVINAGFNINEVKRLGWGIPHWDLDARFRGHKILDDVFEYFGQILIPDQASSLYFIIQK